MHHLTLATFDEMLPFLQGATTALKTQVIAQAVVTDIAAGASIFWEGDTCSQLAVVVTGTVRVYKVGENGREITLYRVEGHESCILTASCILSRSRFPAFAVAETDVRAVLIPAAALRDWVAREELWRNYVLGLLAMRLSGVMATVEEVAFRRMDARVAEFVAAAARPGDPLRMTHQEIALELGTAREVVSRILKDLEREGLLTLGRGTITVLDAGGLRAKAVFSERGVV